ncbi:MAG: hypothetical protein L3J12_10780 [Spirochaetales bacterium]|nr:hypothetical protein [Spirochaetales bacterium]
MTGNKLQQTKPDRAIAPLSAILNYYHQFNFIKPAVYASMLTMQYYIISVTPSEDIILKIQNLRTSIYRKFGLVSARALPVMIPVGFSDTRIDQDIFSDIIRRGFISTRNRAETRGNDIFLSLSFEFSFSLDTPNNSSNSAFLASGRFLSRYDLITPFIELPGI